MYKFNWIIILFILFNTFSTQLIADTSIKDINKKSIELEKKIKTNTLYTPIIMVDARIGDPDEGVPPKLNFFFDEQKELIAVHATAGHESWSKDFYYFFEKGKIIKYLEVIDRPDNPPRKAIIYDSTGKVLWKNIAKAEVDPIIIVEIYKVMITSLQSFSSY